MRRISVEAARKISERLLSAQDFALGEELFRAAVG
jgi:hypothetical protein